jgi:peptide/nickel transport system permease protein
VSDIAQAESRELELEDQAGLWRNAWQRLRRNPAAITGAVLVGVFVLAAVLAPLISQYGPNERVGGLNLNPPGPSAEHWFGLDEQGRDFFARVVYGARLSLLIGVVSVAVGLSVGLVLGSLAGYVGGRVDSVVMRAMDIMLAFPGFLLAIGIVTILGRGMLQIMIAVGVTQIPIFARLLRGSILAQRESDYVLAARSLGTPGLAILLVHILPNSIAPVIVQATLASATAIIDVAGLSFIGLGPNNLSFPEWGRMLAENADRLDQAVHLVFFPGFAIVISVLGLNLIGDGLREAIDPKLGRR